MHTWARLIVGINSTWELYQTIQFFIFILIKYIVPLVEYVEVFIHELLSLINVESFWYYCLLKVLQVRQSQGLKDSSVAKDILRMRFKFPLMCRKLLQISKINLSANVLGNDSTLSKHIKWDLLWREHISFICKIHEKEIRF
jgi:hypothetical protein